MNVTTEHVSALRAYIVGDRDAYERLVASQVQAGGPELPVLIAEAFVQAARTRFSPRWTDGDIIRFVAKVRARSQVNANSIDPSGAEQLVRAALGGGTAHSLPGETKALQLPLLAELVADAELDGLAIDVLLVHAQHGAKRISL
jgi:hypothetical protein